MFMWSRLRQSLLNLNNIVIGLNKAAKYATKFENIRPSSLVVISGVFKHYVIFERQSKLLVKRIRMTYETLPTVFYK